MADAAFPNPGSQNPDMALLKTSSSGRGLSACGQYARSRRYRPKADTRRPLPPWPPLPQGRGGFAFLRHAFKTSRSSPPDDRSAPARLPASVPLPKVHRAIPTPSPPDAQTPAAPPAVPRTSPLRSQASPFPPRSAPPPDNFVRSLSSPLVPPVRAPKAHPQTPPETPSSTSPANPKST